LPFLVVCNFLSIVLSAHRFPRFQFFSLFPRFPILSPIILLYLFLFFLNWLVYSFALSFSLSLSLTHSLSLSSRSLIIVRLHRSTLLLDYRIPKLHSLSLSLSLSPCRIKARTGGKVGLTV